MFPLVQDSGALAAGLTLLLGLLSRTCTGGLVAQLSKKPWINLITYMGWEPRFETHRNKPDYLEFKRTLEMPEIFISLYFQCWLNLLKKLLDVS